jgi:5S rRNA maturation endonuclease (ribonuclease M5)
MPISAEELRRKLAEKRKQKAFETSPESPEEASGIARKRVGSAEQYQDGQNKKEGTVTPAHKTRDEIIASNPIVEFLRSRGHKLIPSGENFVTNACPVTSHKKPGHCPVSIDVAKQVWYCNDCKVGGSVIDWEAREKHLSSAEAIRELGGGRNSEKPRKEFVCAYDYTDESGKQLFQAVRYKVPPPKNKTFYQRHEGDRGGWVWNMKGVRRVLYRLPEVIAAERVIVVEGEKDADKLTELGFVATTNVGGAGKWRRAYSEMLRGKDVIIIGDNDDPGRAHVKQLITELSGIARSLKHAPVPDKFKDVSDFIGLKLPKMALQAINKLIGDAPLIDQVDLHGGASAQSEPRKKNDEDALPAPTSIIALAEMDPAIFEKDNVLGNRFLCIEGTMLVIGQSDIGKSSLSMQQDICFALGRSAFGIKPRRPLRILTIQAENDDGDLAEMARGVCDHLGLSAEEKRQVDRNVIYIKEKSKTGVEFLRQLQRLV